MGNLFFPGDERRGDQFSQQAFLRHMVAVEAAWLRVLVDLGVAPADAYDDLDGLVGPEDIDGIALEAEQTGTPVLALVGRLRDRVRVRNATAATWVHRGLTSQDVVDTAMMMMLRDASGVILAQLRRQVELLVELAAAHRDTVMVARTLTQHAVPMTFGLKVTHWLRATLDVIDRPVEPLYTLQLGGAGGTLAAPTELAAATGASAPAATAVSMVQRMAELLGLVAAPPWHSSRSRITRLADAAVELTDVWGRIANDVLLLSRPEVGELVEGGSGGGSSTMPHKRNPVLATQIRRSALLTPAAAASLHVAAMETVDERAAGSWHAEWEVLASLEQITIVACSQMTDLLAALEVRPDRMRANLMDSLADVLSEQRAMAALVGRPEATRPEQYLGATGYLVDEELDRARRYLAVSDLVL